MRLCWERLLLILTLATPEIAELGSAIAAMAWGGWLLLPTRVFEGHPALFRPMAALSPQWVWGAGMLTLGIAQASCAVCGPRRDPRGGARRQRRTVANVLVAAWAFVTVMYLAGDWRTPANAVYSLGVLANAWLSIRLSHHWRAPEEA